MNLWIRTIYLCTSLLLFACSSNEEVKEEASHELNYSELTYGLKIDADFKKTLIELDNSELKKSDNGYEGEFEELKVKVNISGIKKLGAWKIEWSGNKDQINSFSKRLINVLETQFSDLQGMDNYYSCRYQSGNAQVILELTIWENKIELISR